MSVPLLEVQRLEFGYPGRTVGSGLDLSLEDGEVVCVLGPNGGGKTTLLKTLLGLLPPLGGRIAIRGDPLSRMDRRAIASHLAYVPQEHELAFAWSVNDVVLMGRSVHVGWFRAPGREDRAACAKALGSLGIDALGAQPFAEISGGERQLVLVARALAQEARLLVMDEPTSGLDLGNQTRVLERIRALAADGITVILSTHDPSQAFAMADRALLLGGGRAMACGAPAEVLQQAAIEALYGVAVRTLRDPEGALGFAPRIGRDRNRFLTRTDRDA